MTGTSLGDPTLTRRVRPGTRLDPRRLTTVTGDEVVLPSDGVVHLQLRRFAGCPVCNLHLRTIVTRHDELRAAGVTELVVFHSTAEELRRHVTDLPFAVIADPDKQLYRAYGAESSPMAMLHPRAWGTIVHALGVSVWSIVRGRGRPPKLFPDGGRYGLPAELLVGPDGTVIASHYGQHAGDHWSVDDVLALVGAPRRPS